jgi:hypothetical protein
MQDKVAQGTRWNGSLLSPQNHTTNGHHALRNIPFLTDVLKHGIEGDPPIAPSDGVALEFS